MLPFLPAFNIGKLIAVGVAVAVVYFGYKFVDGLVQDKANLQATVVQKDAIISGQKATIKDLIAQNAKFAENEKHIIESVQILAEVQKESTSETRRLNNIFAKHDFDRLLFNRPGMVETRVNNGTDDAFGLLEQSSAAGRDSIRTDNSQ